MTQINRKIGEYCYSPIHSDHTALGVQSSRPLHRDKDLINDFWKLHIRNSLAVQWLGLCAFTASGRGSIPGQGTKIPQAEQWAVRSQNRQNYVSIFIKIWVGPWKLSTPTPVLWNKEKLSSRQVTKVTNPIINKTVSFLPHKCLPQSIKKSYFE